MAEVAAAGYALETVAEGAIIGTYALSKATAPLHVRFRKLPSPSPTLSRSSHSLNVVKGRAYMYGGDVWDGSADQGVHVVTLPTDVSLRDVDYKSVDPQVGHERPLEKYQEGAKPGKNAIPQARACHAATAIGDVVYIFGGRPPASISESVKEPFDEGGVVHAFDTLSNTWSTIQPHPTKCSSGVPSPRTYASAASTPHPLPGTTEGARIQEHGTFFLHGGYDAGGRALRDIWAFDVASRTWSQWPEVPPTGTEDVPGESKICCTESRIWRVGDGFGKVQWLDVVRDEIDDFSGKGEIGVSPKNGRWERVKEKTQEGEQNNNKTGDKAEEPLQKSEIMPIPRKGYGMIPITTGAGREYLLLLLGEDGPGSMIRDVWSFQIRSGKRTPAVLKDVLREAVGKQSGENTWARADVVESTKDEGPLEVPSGLARFGFDSWRDLGGGAAILWGGKDASGKAMGNGWMMVID